MKITVSGRGEFEAALAELTLAGRGWKTISIGASPAEYEIEAGPTHDEFLLGDLAENATQKHEHNHTRNQKEIPDAMGAQRSGGDPASSRSLL
jgi:hypothetical protein